MFFLILFFAFSHHRFCLVAALLTAGSRLDAIRSLQPQMRAVISLCTLQGFFSSMFWGVAIIFHTRYFAAAHMMAHCICRDGAAMAPHILVIICLLSVSV